MKKGIVLILAVLVLASPVFAEVLITCTSDGNEVTVSYDASSEPNLVRAFGLDVAVSAGTITDVVVLDPNYRIFPGQIVIEDGEVVDYNTPYIPGTLGAGAVTVELGSLYTEDANYASDPNAGYNMQPSSSGELFSFYVTDDCTVSFEENAARAGVVLENPSLVIDVNAPGCSVVVVTDPYAGTCWDIAHCPGQPSGDATCDGNVNIMDILKVKQGWLKSYGHPSYNCCADFDHGGMINIMDVLKVKQNWLVTGLGGDSTQSCPIQE